MAVAAGEDKGAMEAELEPEAGGQDTVDRAQREVAVDAWEVVVQPMDLKTSESCTSAVAVEEGARRLTTIHLCLVVQAVTVAELS